MKVKKVEFQLLRYHPNCHFEICCVYKYSRDKITKERRYYKIKLFVLQKNCTLQQDKPITVLLGTHCGDKITLKRSHRNSTSIWKTEEIDVNNDNCILAQTSNCLTSAVHPLMLTCKFWLKFNDFSLDVLLTMLINLTDMFLNQTDCDAHFCFEDGQSIGAHVVFLKIRSPVLAAMFEREREKSKMGRVFIQDIAPDVFHQLLHYIYSGRTKTPLTHWQKRPFDHKLPTFQCRSNPKLAQLLCVKYNYFI